MEKVDCPRKDECSDYPNKCSRCRLNKKKKSYFIPEINPFPLDRYRTTDKPQIICNWGCAPEVSPKMSREDWLKQKIFPDWVVRNTVEDQLNFWKELTKL